MRHPLPDVPQAISAAELGLSAASIAATMEPSGAIPWTDGEHTDVWNHVEAAMALMVAGRIDDAERAYAWVPQIQRDDGSVPLKIVAGVVEDASGETNMSAYVAVGVWHHWLLRRDSSFVHRMWPTVRRGLDFAVRMQLPWGGVAWSQEWDRHGPAKVNREALLAGSSSIYHAFRAGVALADLVGEPQPDWEIAGGHLAQALHSHRDRFLDKSTFSMDWYYPVLGGALRGDEAAGVIASRWDDFVVPGLGVRCVDTNPWVTGAETAELVIALEALGDRSRATRLFEQIRLLRSDDGRYWTGVVYPEGLNWPVEHTTYTAAAVILAADSLSDATPGADIFRGASLPDLQPQSPNLSRPAARQRNPAPARHRPVDGAR